VRRSIGWLAVSGVAACTTVFGDFRIQETGGASTTGTGAGGASPTGGDAGGCVADAAACSGACVDLQTDKHNCRRCGHDCMYGDCVMGMCQPWMVAPNTTVSASSMDADAVYVVWADLSQQVHQVAVGGGTVVPVSPSEVGVGTGPALRNATLAFLGSGSVYAATEGQGTASPQSSVPSSYWPSYLALSPDGATAFLLGVDNSPPHSYYLLACPLVVSGFCQPMGAPIDMGMVGVPLAINLRVNTKYAFWIYTNGSPSLHRYTLGASGVEMFDFTSAGAFQIAIDKSNVYWVAQPMSTIYSLPQPFSASATSKALTSTAAQVAGLASDDTYVYWGEYNPSGSARLWYVSVGGGHATTMYTSLNDTAAGAVGPVVAAGAAVYWADTDYATSPPKSNIMGIAQP
jgi:hypothetical protein